MLDVLFRGVIMVVVIKLLDEIVALDAIKISSIARPLLTSSVDEFVDTFEIIELYKPEFNGRFSSLDGCPLMLNRIVRMNTNKICFLFHIKIPDFIL